MKKFILLFAFVAVSITTNAQTWIGGNIGFDYHSAEGTSQTEIGFDLMGRYDLSLHIRHNNLPKILRQNPLVGILYE